MRRKLAVEAPVTAAPIDTVRAISENTEVARETLIGSAERYEKLAARYREIAATIDETN